MFLLCKETSSCICIDHWFANPLCALESPVCLFKISVPELTVLEFDLSIWEWNPNIVIFLKVCQEILVCSQD